MLKEEWKIIEGYEDYWISSFGRVLSLKFNHTDNNPRILKQILVGGYYCVNLYKDGKMKMLKVHRLVAIAFIPNPNNYPCVNHKDEDKINNFVWVNEDGSVDLEKSNLEWCSVEYNSSYGTARQRGADKRRIHTKEEKKAIRAARYKKWREDPLNKERLKEYQKNYRAEHKEELSKKQKERWASLTKEEKDIVNKKARERYAKNKLGINATAGY